MTSVLLIAVLSSIAVNLDSSVVTVVLPAVRKDLAGGLAVQQWTVEAYLVALASLVIVAASLADRFGHMRVWGVLGFSARTERALMVATETDADRTWRQSLPSPDLA